MAALLPLDEAAVVLRRGGLIVYPTEAVWGLGCDPFDATAVQRLLRVKQRPESKGLILIAAALDQLAALIDLDLVPEVLRAAVLASWPGPNTWSIPCTELVPEHLRGSHATLAVRVTAHPEAAALCRAFGGALVSTSANRAGEPPARMRHELDPRLLADVDGEVAGVTGGLERATPIRDARSGEFLRA